MTVRQTVLAALLARLATITIAGGFQTDAGERLFVGETPTLGPDDPPAAIAVLVRDETEADYAGYGEGVDGVIEATLPIEIQAIARTDVEGAWQLAEDLLADVKQAVETADRSFSGALTKPLQRGRVRTLPRASGSTGLGLATTYTATYAETWGGSAL